jgi:hypothetical protein
MKLSVTMMVLLFFGWSAWAQIDSSSNLLLQSTNSSAEPSVLDSTRFKVRTSTPKKAVENPTKAKVEENDDDNDEDDESAATAPVQKPVEKVKAPVPTTATVVVPTGAQNVTATVTVPMTLVSAPQATATVSPTHRSAMTDVVLGGPSEAIDKYKSILDTNDVRRNWLEVGLGTGYLYNESKSNYYYRNYNDNSPLLDLNATGWITPFFGLSADYMTSMGASIDDSPSGASSSAAVTHQWIEVGLRFRRFFGYTPKAPSLTFGLNFREYQLGVPSYDDDRHGLRTSGAALSVQTEFPQSSHYAWTFDFSLEPNAAHSEIDTGLTAKSGSGVKADVVAAAIGGIYHFSRANQVYWKLSHTIERDIFSGEAQQADPILNSTPQGVTVTNSFTILQFGYILGD